MKLSDTLETIYVGKRQNLDDYDKVSSILITKILMGTLGCVPAYDRYLVFTLSNCNIASISYNKQSLSDIAGYYNENRDKLEEFRNKVKESRKMDYPEMKILDMIFWYYGLSADQKVKEVVRE